MKLSEVARRTGLTRAAARRFLLTLASEGYAGTDGDRFYLRAPVLEIGFAYLSSMSFSDLVQPILVDLARKFGQIVQRCRTERFGGNLFAART